MSYGARALFVPARASQRYLSPGHRHTLGTANLAMLFLLYPKMDTVINNISVVHFLLMEKKNGRVIIYGVQFPTKGFFQSGPGFAWDDRVERVGDCLDQSPCTIVLIVYLYASVEPKWPEPGTLPRR